MYIVRIRIGDAGMRLIGTRRNDFLIGGSGADTLSGRSGNDTLDGQAGADTMIGGAGDDIFMVDNAGDIVVEAAGEGADTVVASISYTLGTEVERLSFTGTAALNGIGNTLNNAINGNSGANLLRGLAGNDNLDGNAGTDTLVGGGGQDVLTGGAGADLFKFLALSGSSVDSGLGTARDRITDFTSGQDRIDLTAWFRTDTFTFLGTAPFIAGKGGQVRITVLDGKTVLQADVDLASKSADGVADAEIELSNTSAINAADLVGASTPNSTPPLKSDKPAGVISVAVGTDLQALINAANPGAVFWLEPGVHRLAAVTPKANQQFVGATGAVLSGAKLLTGFAQSGADWFVGGQTQQGAVRAANQALPGFSEAGHPDALFMNNLPLLQVGSRADLGPGKYYFDYAADRIYLRDNPAGQTIEAAVSPYAFRSGATGVVIKNLTIEKYAAPIQYGAIGGDQAPIGWQISNNEVRLNYGVGILAGSNSTITDNYVHDNGEMGVGGNGVNILVKGNEIARNGYFSGISPYWEGGGTKFANTTNLVVQGNYSHNNNGYGLWTDINNIYSLYENNRVEYNSGGGINHEISYDAVIRNNTFVGNGTLDSVWLWGAAVQIQNSQNVEVYGNTIDMSGAGNGIAFIQQDRGTGTYGPWIVAHNSAYDNVLISDSDVTGNSGAVADFNVPGLLAGGNTFDHNQYNMTSGADDHWVWGDFYSWAAFRATSGQEAHGVLFA